ncbi:MAG: metallophosphoesterase [Terrimicrobiaceae bacterium]
MQKNEIQSYDIIGDIHGHADELRSLLENLGYENGNGAYRHPEGRKIIFLGDYIDRGPKIREVLEIVRGMVDAGQALAILGNHELNAIRFQTCGEDGDYLRPRTPKNVGQHQATLDQFPDPVEWTGWIQWFAGLPLSLDLGDLRVVHASWDDQAIKGLQGMGRLEGKALAQYSRKGSSEFDAISRILNGPEACLPEAFEHQTADGAVRQDIRVKWWMPLDGLSCRQMVFPPCDEVPDIAPESLPHIEPYSESAPPVFFGHYAQKDEVPSPIRPNLACLDYGTGKGGFLCAYRWDGEQEIDIKKFVLSGEPKNS